MTLTLAPFPEGSVQQYLTNSDWDSLKTSWASIFKNQTKLLKEGQETDQDIQDQLVLLLLAWLEAKASGPPGTTAGPESKIPHELDSAIYEFSCEIFQRSPPDVVLSWEFLSDFSAVYSNGWAGAASAADAVEKILGPEGQQQAMKSLTDLKKDLVKSLHAAPRGDLSKLTALIVRVRPLVKASPSASSLLMSGDDFLDGLVAAYRSMNPQLREAIIGMACLCLLGLGSGNTALLGDQLYALKTAADEHRDGPLRSEDSLVAQLVSETPILKKLRKLTQSHAAPASRQTILSRLDALEAYRSAGVETAARRKAGKGRTPSKGKGRAMIVDPGRSISGVRSATIAQLQEVFPDLGAGFIARLLDEYGDDADHAMSTLYEGLPEHLEDADKAESLESYLAPTHFEPHLPSRKNAFDGDELDKLAVQTSKLSFGKTLNAKTADDVLKDRSSAPSKDMIKSALKSFDPDDDERDDTYDADDVGGAVPTADNPDDEEDDPLDEVLFQTYRKNPEVFDRTPDVRKSREREALRKVSGQTDEAIEGWALMLAQNPRRQRQLERRYGIERITQNELQRTSYREAGSEDGEEAGSPSRSGGVRGSRGRGRGFRGGNVAGSSGDRDTAGARRRKEANKGSRANHNRREGHDKKMARSGFAP